MQRSYRADDARVTMLERCRALRGSSTDAERLLWTLLRNRQVAGAKFRRQHQYGPYLLDFFCPERRLIIEVDGSQHLEAAGLARDAQRTAYLQSYGMRVLRFTNREVLQETEGIVMRIWDEVERTPAPPLPSP